LHNFNIIVWGGLGAGKTLWASVLLWYLKTKYEIADHKARRLNKYLKPDYLRQLNEMYDSGKMRVYSNIELKDEFGYTSQDVWSVLTQKVKAIEKGILFTDEMGVTLGKWVWNAQQQEKDS